MGQKRPPFTQHSKKIGKPPPHGHDKKTGFYNPKKRNQGGEGDQGGKGGKGKK
jgi:hypothetical protein